MRKHRLRTSSDDGFTLSEMLVALGLLSTAVLALLGGFLTSAKSIQGQQENSRALRVALDRNEALRLVAYDDPALAVGAHTGTAAAPGGRTYTYTTTVTERDARPTDTVKGDLVKDIRTEVVWTQNGQRRSHVQQTSIATSAKTLGIPSGYEQAIRSMTVSPDPSASVNFDGHTSVPIVITLVLSGHALSDTVNVAFTDDRGPRTLVATTTDARYWRATLPAGTSGLKKVLGQGVRFDLGFSATTNTGLTSNSTLAVFGPVDNPPVISTWSVSPAPISTISNGQSRFQNRADVTFSCTITGLNPATPPVDSVKATYIGETGPLVEINLTRTSVAGTTSTWTHTFARSTTYFGTGANLPFTCVVKRASDGGPASKVVNVTVGRG